MFARVQTIRSSVATKAPRCIAARAEPKDTAQDLDGKAKAAAKSIEPDGLRAEVADTLEPRVEQLRQNFSDGTENMEKPNEVMKFSGPIPEVVNGRLAMLGFTAGLVAERYSGTTILQQFSQAPLLVLGGVATIIVASLVPVLKGSKVLDDGTGERMGGGFNFTTELVNGRAAMIGIALVIAYEAITGSPIFNIL